MKRILILTLLLSILLIGGCKKLPDDVKELKEMTEGMSKRDKVEVICKYGQKRFIEQCPEEGNCYCEMYGTEDEKCYNKEEYREKLIKDCNVVSEEPINCNKYGSLCFFGYDGFKGGDISYRGRTGYYIGRCDLKGDRCVYLAENMEHYMI